MHPWVEELRPQLEYVVEGTQDQYLTRLQQKGVDMSEEQLHPYLFDAFHLGREFEDQQVMDASARILQSRIPDLEQRMPFYEAMFDIMDKGRLGKVRYELTEQLFQQLRGDLIRKTVLPEDQAWFYTRRLAHDLAFVPGPQFAAEVDSSSLPRHLRVLWVSDYLHRPMRKVMTVLEERSSAAFHYDLLLKDKPAGQG